MTDNILVSIITVTYNAQDFLEQTMQSVFSQTYPDIEYLVIDGGSTDNTTDIIKKHDSKLAFWISEKDDGIYDAMNKGIRIAKGNIIGIINASDYYEPTAVQTVVDAYVKNKDVDIFHGNINMLNADGSFFKLKKPNTNLNDLVNGTSLYHPTFFVTKDTYINYGLYDTCFKIAADFDFTLRCYLNGVKFYHLDQIISNFRKGGVSTQHEVKSQVESREVLIKNGYSEETVRPVFRQWKKTSRKNRLSYKAYQLLRIILPASILTKIAAKIVVK